MALRGDEQRQKFGRNRLSQVQHYIKNKGAKLTKPEATIVAALEKLPYDFELKGHQINDIDDVAVRIEKDLGISAVRTPNPGKSETEPETVIDE
jgi:hypothetical protein